MQASFYSSIGLTLYLMYFAVRKELDICIYMPYFARLTSTTGQYLYCPVVEVSLAKYGM